MGELNNKLIQLQQKLKVPKLQYNEFNKFNYRNVEDILEQLKPMLLEEGLSLVLTDTMEYIGERYYIKATAILSNGEESIISTAYAREDENRPGMSESQVTGCSSSYARKYALCGLLCISSEPDSDSFDNSQNKAVKEQKGIPVPTDTNNSKKQPKNSQILKDFCSTKKTEEGVDKNDLLNFYNFYLKKAESWTGKFNVNELYNRWQKTKIN